MRLPIILCCAALLGGCAGLETAKEAWYGLTETLTGKDNSEPPRELAADFQPKLKLKVLWDEDVGDGTGGRNVNLTLAVNEDTVISVDHKGRLEAHNRLNGEKRWRMDSEIAASAGPVLTATGIVIGSQDGEVASYAVADGSLQWKAKVSSTVLALPDVANGIIVVRGSDGRITALDAATGGVRWHHDHSAPLLAVRSKGRPFIADGKVLDGFGGGKLIALNLKNGQTVWEALVALPHGRSEIDRLLDVNAVPAVRGDTLYVSGYQGGVAAVALRNGEVQWRQEKIFTYTGLSGEGRALFLADANSDVWRLEMRGGNDLWKQAELHQRRVTQPIPVKDYLALGDLEGYVHSLSQEDGSLLARVQVDSDPIEAAPVVFDGVIYVYTSGGTVAALNVE